MSYKEGNLNPIWSISVYKCNNLLDNLSKSNFKEAVLTAKDVNDIKAEFVADPFIIKGDNKFYMFFEVLEKYKDKASIGLATSVSGEKWNYEKIVLNEPFHLSYPYVFKDNGKYYMMPECGQSGYVKLYIAEEFPFKWKLVSNLLVGTYADSSIIYDNDMYWIFAEKKDENQKRNCNLHLFYSKNLSSDWHEHPKSPLIVNNVNIARPAGRVIKLNNDIIRFSQNSNPYYGKSLNMFKVEKLTETEYEENQIKIELEASDINNTWNKDGMHHIDCCEITSNEWIIAVDGHYFKKTSFIDFVDRKFNRGLMRFFNIIKRFRLFHKHN